MRWRPSAHQLLRLLPSGKRHLLFVGSAAACLAWARRRQAHVIRNGRLWIEDVARPARVLGKPGPARAA